MRAPFLLSLRCYLAVIALLNLLWEFAHMPLYTIWSTGTVGAIVFAAIHCTGGDLLIATSTLMLSLLTFGAGWPRERVAVQSVIVSTMALGVGYTLFSEWLNVVVREAWTYSELVRGATRREARDRPDSGSMARRLEQRHLGRLVNGPAVHWPM